MKYENPVIRGFNPDPSIVRNGRDYYLVTSSFEYFPGLPVYHSTDLVNWEQVGNALQRAEEFPLDTVGDSGGMWAPTIRFHAGLYYVTATLQGYGSFIVTAEDPAGTWSAPVFLKGIGGIDPSILFDDGHLYYCTNESLDGREMISMEELDLETFEVVGERRALSQCTDAHFLEAPHVYHIGRYYYLFVAQGGTFFTHMENVFRSENVWGPYESCPYNPVLTNMFDPTWQVQCSGHADLFDDADGNFWVVHLGTRLSRRTMTHLGRETFLTPVHFVDGWPVCGEAVPGAAGPAADSGVQADGDVTDAASSEVQTDGDVTCGVSAAGAAAAPQEGFFRPCGYTRKAVLSAEGPGNAVQRKISPFLPDFSRESWEPQWIFLRHPDMRNYARGDGHLKITPASATMADLLPTFAGVRPLDFDCVIDTEFEFEPEAAHDEAGLCVRLDRQFYVTCGVRMADKRPDATDSDRTSGAGGVRTEGMDSNEAAMDSCAAGVRADGADSNEAAMDSCAAGVRADGAASRRVLTLTVHAEDVHHTVAEMEIPAGSIRLRMAADKEKYAFSWAAGTSTAVSSAAAGNQPAEKSDSSATDAQTAGENDSATGAPFTPLGQVSTRFVATEFMGRCFTGTVPGLYATRGEGSKAVLDVSAFSMR